MSSSRSPRVLLRHLANLLAPGLVFLPSYAAFVQFQGYPLWRPEVLVLAGLMLLAGLPPSASSCLCAHGPSVPLARSWF